MNKKACRVSAVLDPVKLVITNYPEGETEEMEAINNPENVCENTAFSRIAVQNYDFFLN